MELFLFFLDISYIRLHAHRKGVQRIALSAMTLVRIKIYAQKSMSLLATLMRTCWLQQLSISSIEAEITHIGNILIKV